jgi:hypothetical protein
LLWGGTKGLFGSPSLADIDFEGHRVRKGCKIWPVGTWPLKGAFYSDLRKEGLRSGAEVDPPGYCHFASWLDDRASLADQPTLEDDDVVARLERLGKANAGLFR